MPPVNLIIPPTFFRLRIDKHIRYETDPGKGGEIQLLLIRQGYQSYSLAEGQGQAEESMQQEPGPRYFYFLPASISQCAISEPSRND